MLREVELRLSDCRSSAITIDLAEDGPRESILAAVRSKVSWLTRDCNQCQLGAYYIGVTEHPRNRFYDASIGHIHRGWCTMHLLAVAPAPVARYLELALIAEHEGNAGCKNKGKGGERVPLAGDGAPRFLYICMQ